VTARAVKRPQFSPLRYPGGKSALFGLLSATVRANGASGGTYVEPYAGGAGIALGLLLTEQVERVVVNDLDPAIYSFWMAVTKHSEQFMSKLASVKLDVDEWQRQRRVYLKADSDDALGLGFATFFLNRTNRSGVLNAGVIGGQDQTGNYKIDARFNRESLLGKYKLIARYSSRITVTKRDGLEVIAEHVEQPNTLTYADPPYFEKGSLLYLNAFGQADHEALADVLNEAKDGSWMLTYDDHPVIEAMYPDRSRFDIGVNYSVHAARKSSELLVTSDALILPDGYATARP
jgi:DNA adenine methylase